MAQLEQYKGGYYLWHYLPSVPAAVVFLLLFLAATIAHFWRMFKTKTWFCSVIAIGGLFEFIGYAARAAAHDRTGRMMPFVIQNVYILVAPALFAASIYMTLGRVVRAIHGEQHSIIRTSWLTTIFVTGDIASFVIQGGAAGLMVTGSHAQIGQAIVIVGLVIQFVWFGLFGVTAGIFYKRMCEYPTEQSYMAGVPWRRILKMLFVCSALIMIRSAFRIVEYAMGANGYLLTHEWPLYIFDSLLMFVVMVVFLAQYPCHLVPKKADVEDGQLLGRLSASQSGGRYEPHLTKLAANVEVANR